MRKTIRPAEKGRGAIARAENALLVECLLRQNDQRANLWARDAEDQYDWKYLISSASYHKVLPLVYDRLGSTIQGPVPAEILDEIKKRSHAIIGANLYRTAELARIARILNDHGIDVLALKGPTLGSSAYRALRQYGDLDLLVRDHDTPMTIELLLKEGYKAQAGQVDWSTHWRRGEAARLAGETSGVVVELHTRLLPNCYAFRPDMDNVWSRTNTLDLYGHEIRVLAPEDLLIFLCVHGSKHRWQKLIWLCDVVEVVRMYLDIDWEVVTTRARILRSTRMLHLGLYLGQNLLEMPLSNQVREQMKPDAAVYRLATAAMQCMFALKPSSTVSDRLTHELRLHGFHLAMTERFRDRMGYYAYLTRRWMQGGSRKMLRYLQAQ